MKELAICRFSLICRIFDSVVIVKGTMYYLKYKILQITFPLISSAAKYLKKLPERVKVKRSLWKIEMLSEVLFVQKLEVVFPRARCGTLLGRSFLQTRGRSLRGSFIAGHQADEGQVAAATAGYAAAGLTTATTAIFITYLKNSYNHCLKYIFK